MVGMHALVWWLTEWSTDGCVLTLTDDEYYYCTCSHLTVFSAVSITNHYGRGLVVQPFVIKYVVLNPACPPPLPPVSSKPTYMLPSCCHALQIIPPYNAIEWSALTWAHIVEYPWGLVMLLRCVLYPFIQKIQLQRIVY